MNSVDSQATIRFLLLQSLREIGLNSSALEEKIITKGVTRFSLGITVNAPVLLSIYINGEEAENLNTPWPGYAAAERACAIWELPVALLDHVRILFEPNQPVRWSGGGYVLREAPEDG
jgi:hypothetical protein